MNNLLETVWQEYPHLFKGFKVKHKNNAGRTVISNIEGVDFVRLVLFTNRGIVKVDICTLLTRSIDSLSDEELLEAESTFNIPSYKSVTKWLMDNKERLDVFIWLLSKGIWTGSKEGVEVIDG